jgi:uncharacterized protein
MSAKKIYKTWESSMRRKDREVTEVEDILGIMEKCDVCRIGLCDDNKPYVVPLNFGYEYQNGGLTLFFHCATEGRKLDILQKNNNACFEMDCSHRLVAADSACNFSMEFESVMGSGKIEILTDEKEKTAGLQVIMAHYAGQKTFQFGEKVKTIHVLKMPVDAVSSKRLKK